MMRDRDEDYASAVYGALVGLFIGASGGWFACAYLFPETLFFPGDTMLFGAVLFGFLGYRYGHRFIDEVWSWLRWLP
jgi:hypothetical protein